MSERKLTRLGFLGAAAGLIAGGSSGTARAALRQTAQLAQSGRPLSARQHAWNSGLAHDVHSNAVAPRFDRLLFFSVPGKPTRQETDRLEASLKTLERLYPWNHTGLLFTVGWGPHYFEHVLGAASPIPHPVALSDFEQPSLDSYDCCIHLASDDEARLARIEAALVQGHRLAGAGSLNVSSALRWRETRTGFVGAGLPASRQNVGGIPPGRPVPATAPLYMGFKSGFRKNQATEDDVTIAAGPYRGGTTMHVSYMRLRLDSWYQLLSDEERVARMYSSETTAGDVKRLTVDAASQPGHYTRDATRYGVIGHAQTSARARQNGKPRIIRRDFDTADGGEAGLHFVALQRSIDDFVATRKAMNAPNAAYLNPAISDTVNNGINEFIFVLKRANYLIPPRNLRSFPGLDTTKAGRA